MARTIRAIGVLASAALLLSAVGSWAQDWPQWRGPNRDAKLTSFNAPKAWPKTLTQKWSKTVGAGVSSPTLVGDKIYTFGRIGGDEVTTCLEASTGNELWHDENPTKPVGGPASGYGGPRSTPAIADGKVFTLGVNGTFSCLDAVTGKVVWRKETGARPQFNTSTSPLVADGKCIVFLKALTAFDVANGEVKWEGPTGTPYGSPTLMTVAGVKMIVTPTEKSLTGTSLSDGKVLWETALPPGNYMVNYSTPIIDGNTVIYISPSKGAGSSMALSIEKDGGDYKATDVWKSSGAYQYNTPVLKDGLIFGLSAGKTFFCMDAKSGKVLWTDDTPRGEAGGVLDGGSVIIALTGPAPAGGAKGGKGFGKGGEINAGNSELVVFEPSSASYKEIVKYKLSPSSGLAYPIVAGNRIYVKGNTEITLHTIE